MSATGKTNSACRSYWQHICFFHVNFFISTFALEKKKNKQVRAAKSNVCNLVAVYKWWWGNVGSKAKEQSRTRTKNIVENSRTE
jgi:hypothetical protein